MRTSRILLLATLSVSPVSAQESRFAPDPRVDAIFSEYDRPDVPGCAVGVYRDGAILYARGYGLADLEHGVPITPATVFDIGSTSKQFAAATIVLLEQEGKLSLDDDVRRFIPEFPEYQRPITIRHLLHHTSGIRDYIGLLRLTGVRTDDVTTPDDALQMLIRQRALNFAPGDEHLYSNSGYFLLSIIIERATGRSLRDEAHDRIFAPLGMTSTSYLGSYRDIIPNRAIGYEPVDSGFAMDMPRWLQLGDGAIFTTVEDLFHWGENFRHTRVGGTAMRDALLTRGRLNDGEELNYALGIMHGTLRGLATEFHGGSWGGYLAEFLRIPSQRYGVAVLCNRSDADPPGLAREVAEVHLANVMEPEAPPPVAAERAVPVTDAEVALRPHEYYVGSYRPANSSRIITVRVVGGALRITEPGDYGLVARSADEFEVVGAPVRLVFAPGTTAGAPASRITELMFDTPQATYERFTETPFSAATAGQLVGSYYSEELDTSMRVSLADSGLRLVSRNRPPAPLRAVGGDEFIRPGLGLQFTRDATGNVDGFLLSQGRARDIRFSRQGNEP